MRGPHHRRRIGLLLVAALFAIGCVDDDYVVSGPAWVELGTGVADFVSLADARDVAIVTGVQGGYMIPLSLRAGGVVAGDAADPSSPDNPAVAYRAYLVDSGLPVGVATRVRGLTTVDRDTVELVGTWLLFDPTVDRAELFDRDVRIELELTDATGARAEDAGVCRVLAPER